MQDNLVLIQGCKIARVLREYQQKIGRTHEDIYCVLVLMLNKWGLQATLDAIGEASRMPDCQIDDLPNLLNSWCKLGIIREAIHDHEG